MDVGHLENGGNQATSLDISPTMEEILVIPDTSLPHTNITPAPVASNLENPARPRPALHSVSAYRKVAIIFSIYLGAGTICFYLVRHQISGTKTNSILDAMYLTFVSMTCVGYGDLSPDGTLSILLVSLFSILGMVLIGLVLGQAADVLIEKQEQLLERTVGTAPVKEQELESKKVKKMRNRCIMLVVLLVVLMAVGTPVLLAVEDLDLIHAFYCINATLTSVGSKKCFSTKSGRVFALFWMLIGAIYVGQMLFTFTEMHAERRRKKLMDLALDEKMTISKFLEADIDDDGAVKISEFILQKLKQMRRISQNDIGPILDCFKRLDLSNMGLEKDIVDTNSMSFNGGKEERPPTVMDGIRPILNIWLIMKRVFIAFYIYLGVGTLCFYLMRHQISGMKTNGFVDALYFTFILTSSVGYGDLTPDTTLSLLLAALCSFMGKLFMGIMMTISADVLLEQHEMPLRGRRKKLLEYVIRHTWWKFIILFVFHIAVGTTILIPVEDVDFIHSFYCISATLTSVGSDKCFSTAGGRVFALFWIYNALILSPLAVFTFTEIQTRRRRKLQQEALKQNATPADINGADLDLDKDGVVVSAEYILYTLKNMGQIDSDDITLIIKAFQKLDVKNKGQLTPDDIVPY